MNRNGWDTGDRRTDVYIVLLLAAVCLRDAARGATELLDEFPSFDSPWLGFAELVLRFGFFVPLLVAGGMLMRLCGVRTAVLFLATYALSSSLLLSGRALIDAQQMLGSDWDTPTWLLLVAQGSWLELSDAVLPILAAIHLYRTSGATPAWVAARLTRFVCVVMGLVELSVIGLTVVTYTALGWSMFGTIGVTWYTVTEVLPVPLALLQLLAGMRLIRQSRLVHRWLWSAALAGAAITVVEELRLLGYVWTMRRQGSASLSMWPFVGDRAVQILAASTVAAVILWYWWPVLRGRVGPELEPDMPHCPSCGYCVYGIASPRCPECGEPLPATGSAAPEPRTTV